MKTIVNYKGLKSRSALSLSKDEVSLKSIFKKGIGKSPTTLRFSNIPIEKKSMHQEENTMDIKLSKYSLKH